MGGADDVTSANSPQTSRVMHDTPSPRRRSTVPPRRISSAPDLHAPSSSDSDSSSMSIDESSSSTSSSVPRSLDLSYRRSLEMTEHSAPEATHHIERIPPVRSATEPISTHASPQQQPALESTSRTLEEMHRVIRELQRRRGRHGARGLWITTRAFFGYGPDGSAARREFVTSIGRLIFGAGQIGATITVLNIAARQKSPTNDQVNEWKACTQPLGEWCALWCVRVVLGAIMSFWAYRRKFLNSPERSDETVHEPNALSTVDGDDLSATASRRRSTSRHTGAQRNFKVSEIAFARLTTLLSLFALIWFVTAHVLLYTSVHTCRISSPHLWWLMFGIICIGYLIIVEVILVAFLVFILGPLIYILLNLILICMGRTPLRHASHIHPEIGKLSQKAVDLIPLVLYIPAPAPKESKETGDAFHDVSESRTQQPLDTSTSPLAVPEAAHVHTYPPVPERPRVSPPTTSTSGTPRPSRHRFTFRRIRLRNRVGNEVEKGKEKQLKGGSPEQSQLYEDKWERGEYPFVKLEGNRAACAICLSDFDEPRRVRYSMDSRPAEDLDHEEKGLGGDAAKSQHDGVLRLTDAGEGAQPLRLLACAHVFHKTCLDPWLTEVSGRCPVCQRPVEVDNEKQRQRA